MALAGSGAEDKAATAEANVAWVRAAVIAFNIASYWTLLYPGGRPVWAMAITVVASTYAAYVLAAKPYLRYPILATSAWTAVTDGLLITAWIHATGDFDSPYYLLWFLSLFAVAFRYAWRATFAAAVLYDVAYLAELAATGGLLPAGHPTQVLVRCTYVLLVGAIGALLGRETQRLFEERFHLGAGAKEAERLRALAAASQEALLVHRDGLIIEANEAACRLLGRPRTEVVGAVASQFLVPTDTPALTQRLAHPSDDPIELHLSRPDGSQRTVLAQARTLDFEGRAARFTSVRDVTDERAAEASRAAALQAELEVARLKEMDRFKSDFINTAAHELNTPLTPIKLQLHILKSRIGPERVDERRSVDVLDRNLERLGLLVQDMLDVARLQSGRLRLDPEPSDVTALLRDAADTFRDNAEHGGIRLHLDCPPRLVAVVDAKRLTQVVYNLLSNAFKFTPRGGHVDVVARQDGDWLVLDVTDDGVGLSAAQTTALFQPFTRLHADEGDRPGTGLGLYICKGIVERHGGTLSVRSPGPGLGATFTTRLPIAGPRWDDR